MRFIETPIAGVWVIEQWNLPVIYREAARCHHAPSPEGNELTMLVHAACEIASRLGFSILPRPDADVDEASKDQLYTRIVDSIACIEAELRLWS